MTLINALSGDLTNMSGMVDRIGLSYYPDWHGSYAVLQRNLVEIAKVLPGVKLNIAEMSPPSSGRVTDPLSDPNHPVGFTYTVQSQGNDTMAAMKTINDIPNNAGTGVWPWAGTNVFGTGSGANGTLRASFKVWNDAFAKNVVESHVFATTRARVAPTLPTTVTSLDLRTGVRSTVRVTWSAINPASYATPGTFTVNGTANVTNLGGGKGTTMTAVKATVEVT
jgi:arabinogalactan endo-1,4-beta-galactosidase